MDKLGYVVFVLFAAAVLLVVNAFAVELFYNGLELNSFFGTGEITFEQSLGLVLLVSALWGLPAQAAK